MPGKGTKSKKSAASVQPTAGKYAPTSWGQASSTGQHEVTVPSGQLILCRMLGPTALVRMGFLERVDILGGIVQTQHIDRVAGRAASETKEESDAKIEEQMRDMMKDPAKILDAMQMVDDVVVAAVVQPPVFNVPLPRVANEADAAEYEVPEGEEFTPPRVVGKVYVDTVELEDKVFILNWTLGGVADLETFRTELHATVERLADEQVVPDATEPTPGD